MRKGGRAMVVLLTALTIATGAPALATTAIAAPAPVPSPSLAHEHAPAEAFADTREALLARQESDGTRAALAELEARIHADPGIAGICHAIAHELGHRAVERADGDVRAALRHGSEVCGGGFTHGVIETVLGASTHPGRDLLTVCGPRNDGSCFHGVGHGLMFATDMDIDRSLSLCDRAPTTLLSVRCGEGVFMQLFSSDLSAQHVTGTTTVAIADDPRAAARQCRHTRSLYAGDCWFYAPTVWLAVHPEDFTGALAYCRDAVTSTGREWCTRGVGSRTVKYHPDDLTIGSAVCASAGRLTDACLRGMGSYWSVHHEGRVAPASVCRHLTPDSLAARCHSLF